MELSSRPPALSGARSYALMHLCVILFGFTPIVGRLITLSAVPLVWWRMLLAAAVLLVLPATWVGLRSLNLRYFLVCVGAGVVLGLSWMLFYGAIKLSNASVGAICLATAPLFVALGGPLLLRHPHRRMDLVLAVSILPGMALVFGGVPPSMSTGLLVGLLSAMVLTVFSGLHKYLSDKIPALACTCIEMGAGAAFVGLILLAWPQYGLQDLRLHGQDLYLMILFAAVLTALPITLMFLALRRITVFAQQMAVNLEPVYAILLAMPLLGEQEELRPLFYLGVVVIVGAVMIEPTAQWLRGRSARKRLQAGHP